MQSDPVSHTVETGVAREARSKRGKIKREEDKEHDRGPRRAERIHQYSKKKEKEKDSGQELFWVGRKKKPSPLCRLGV